MKPIKLLSYLSFAMLIGASLQGFAHLEHTQRNELQNASNNQALAQTGNQGAAMSNPTGNQKPADQTNIKRPVEKANQTGNSFLDIETGNEAVRETVPYNDANINRGFNEQDYLEPYKFIDAEEW